VRSEHDYKQEMVINQFLGRKEELKIYSETKVTQFHRELTRQIQLLDYPMVTPKHKTT
jgi:hypothetical protein